MFFKIFNYPLIYPGILCIHDVGIGSPHALQSTAFTQSEQFLVQIWHKVPHISLELGNLGCCTPSPEAALCNSLHNSLHNSLRNSTVGASGGTNQVPFRNLCEPEVSKPLPNLCCSSVPLHRWSLLFRHSLGQVFWRINQTHKLCLEPLWCLTSSRDEGWHFCRKVMTTLFCPWRGRRHAERCSEILPCLGQREGICPGLTRQSNPMCSQIHHQFPPWWQVSSCPLF